MKGMCLSRNTKDAVTSVHMRGMNLALYKGPIYWGMYFTTDKRVFSPL